LTNAYANGIRALQQGRLQRALRFLRRAIRFTADMKEVFVEHATTNYGAQFFITGAPKEGDQQVILKPAVFVASSSRSCLCLITLTGTVTVCQVMKLAYVRRRWSEREYTERWAKPGTTLCEPMQ